MDIEATPGLPGRVRGVHHALIYSIREDLEGPDFRNPLSLEDLLLLDDVVTYLVAEDSSWEAGAPTGKLLDRSRIERVRLFAGLVAANDSDSINYGHLNRLIGVLDKQAKPIR